MRKLHEDIAALPNVCQKSKAFGFARPAEEAPLKLIDLGVAGNLQTAPGGYLTDVVGTISTMAPEVFSKHYNERLERVF